MNYGHVYVKNSCRIRTMVHILINCFWTLYFYGGDQKILYIYIYIYIYEQETSVCMCMYHTKFSLNTYTYTKIALK